MTHKSILFCSFILLFLSSNLAVKAQGTLVSDNEALTAALNNAKPGDEIVMADGIWKDVQIKFTSHGTEENPITLRAETPGKVFIEGKSDLKFGGEYLIASGLFFRNGQTPSDVVVEFRIHKDTVANHCSLVNSVILGYNQLKRDRVDRWVEFHGRHNTMDHCYIAGKSNRGPTVRVSIKGNRSIRNYHQITNNHFGPRPPKGGPSGETIQLGDSYSSMSPSNTLVANNLFERCNGEVEVISSKTNFNEFRNNVFYKSEGSLVMRHGNYCMIDGNYFIGDDASDQIGGIRVINTGHWVVNNYFYNLKGSSFRSPLAVMNGIPKSPLNRYNQVTDVVVAFNTYVNCASPWQFGVGTNISQKDVLPASEIRSARAIRTVVANNLIYNEKGDAHPIVAHDSIDGVLFKNNLINNQGVAYKENQGLVSDDFKIKGISDIIFVPDADLKETELYPGFEFDKITKDIFGNSRAGSNGPGAIIASDGVNPEILDKSKYGTTFYSNVQVEKEGKVINVKPKKGALAAAIAKAKDGDVLSLSSGNYKIPASLKIDKKLTIKSSEAGAKPVLKFEGNEDTALFEMHPKGDLVLEGISLKGSGTQMAFASLKDNMSSLYNIHTSDVEVDGFKYILKAYKESFSEHISFVNTRFTNCAFGIELSEEINDKGDYNVENLLIDGCTFDQINGSPIDYYRGGYDESTIGGSLSVQNSTFTNSGKEAKAGILINSYGIVNVDISKNTFENNPVKMVALLWGAKNNTHSDNTLENSGEIKVEENLKLRLLY
ncbi:chondroitinase-B domain-containing protein [Lutimonas halocynthiae]|uniref:chondroitinase-B domain-containing protein n=1 Tax=Lutimonas halocynthiae TaxID=1446477 RepID=UPI0025B539C1|nr:chondroitinase-B domain-containing protein [Lutimonas halocynthiae]MDN3641793.1 chondroitinase-B domain-containing protein [Lutimonas halocynthiae]